MTASGISANGFPDTQSNFQQLQQEFLQLGKDLQAGNLTAAESDFVTLQQDLPQSSVTSSLQSSAATSSQNSATSSTQSSDPIAQAFAQLASDLQAGNLTAAQQDYSKIQQDFQTHAAQGNQAVEGHHHHHHHSESSNGSSDSTGSSAISQLLTELGQELQSGSLTAAQQTYQSLQQDMKQFSQDHGQQAQSASASSSSSLSVSA